MKRCCRTMLVLVALVLAPMIGGTAAAGAEDAPSPVTATAFCTEATETSPASVDVAIDNHSGGPIVVSYVHGFTTAQANNPRFIMREPGNSPSYTVEDGERFLAGAPWDDLRERDGDVGLALIVTNLGLLTPGCDGREATLIATAHNQAVAPDMRQETYAAIAEETYGMLQTWHAYPAMYAMLHPDAQAAVPWGTFVCANIKEHGTADDWTGTVFSIDVVSVQLRDFDYGVTGQHYGDAAQINFEQEIGTNVETRTVGNTTFFVLVDGQYRPFYGNDPTLIAQYADTCDLGGA